MGKTRKPLVRLGQFHEFVHLIGLSDNIVMHLAFKLPSWYRNTCCVWMAIVQSNGTI